MQKQLAEAQQEEIGSDKEEEPDEETKEASGATGLKRGGNVDTNAGVVNYLSIHGTIPGGGVDAKSSLAVEVTQQFINKTMNLRSECPMPDCFIDFRGGDNQSVVTNNTARYFLGFGQKSEFDSATEDLFRKYGQTFAGHEDAESYFSMLLNYQDELGKLDKQIVWEEILTSGEDSPVKVTAQKPSE